MKRDGKPQPDRPGDAFISPGDGFGFRIIAEAGVLPQEIELKSQAAAHRAHLANLSDPIGRKAALAQLDPSQVIAEKARRKLMA